MLKVDLDEFLRLVNKLDRLDELYALALPFIFNKCSADKMLFFRYNSRKKCFDLKVGLNRESVKESKLLKGDISILESEFSLRAREFGSSCNDAIRSFVSSHVSREVKIIEKDSIQPSRFRRIFEEFELNKTILYLPFISRSEVIGFLLISPICDPKGIKDYIESFSCCLDKLLLKKRLLNIENAISSFKPSKRDDKIYELGKTALAVAHEMKNSLVGVIGLFDKLSSYIEDSDKANKYKEIIKSQLDKLYNFVVDINRISKVAEANIKENIDIAEVIDNSIEMASTFGDDVTFSVSIGKNAEWIYANRDQLEQVFLNLFKNSIEAKKGGKVKISITTYKEGDNLIVKVRDNSGGVDEKTLKNMLDPFYTTKSYGTGLGLSIVKSIVESYNGTIKFKNIPGGLECIMKFPLKKVEDENG